MSRFDSWSREELIAELDKLNKDVSPKVSKKQKRQHRLQAKMDAGPVVPHNSRPFDFSKSKARHVAFKVAYFGAKYHGLARSVDVEGVELPSIESHLFQALLTARLIPDMEKCGWSKCGRTDKGVSAFGQVVTLWIRSTTPPKKDSIRLDWESVDAVSSMLHAKQKAFFETLPIEDFEGNENEIPYLSILNRILPEDIRIIGYAPVEPMFDARFSCTARTYNYFFSSFGLNVAKMTQAATLYQGTHDYRNLCKADASKAHVVDFFNRTIYESFITPAPKRLSSPEESNIKSADPVYMFVLKGKAFLWHQVRCMMALLFYIGRGDEEPGIITKILQEPITNPGLGKPSYTMAPDTPLVLVDCEYDPPVNWQLSDPATSDWRSNQPTLFKNESHLVRVLQEQANAVEVQLYQHHRLRDLIVGMGATWTLDAPTRKYVPILDLPRSLDLVQLVNKISRKRASKI